MSYVKSAAVMMRWRHTDAVFRHLSIKENLAAKEAQKASSHSAAEGVVRHATLTEDHQGAFYRKLVRLRLGHSNGDARN